MFNVKFKYAIKTILYSLILKAVFEEVQGCSLLCVDKLTILASRLGACSSGLEDKS